MCGIVGVYAFARHKVSVDHVRVMLASIAHRGPDDANLMMKSATGRARVGGLDKLNGDGTENVGLGHARLRIVDLTQTGAQPMVDPVTGSTIVFNGQIHNYLELRSELEAVGCVFRGASDTEVALYAYRVWGTGCFDRFNGFWAIALHDAIRDDLLLSRDRFAIKPLFVYQGEAGVIFGSEIKALHAHPAVPVALDMTVIHAYAVRHWRWINASTDVFYKGIRQVPAGAIWRIGRDGSLDEGIFWSLESRIQELDLTDAEAVSTLYELLADSVALRLRADVPVGHLLSGGIDSSSIVSISRVLTGKSPVVLSARFSDPDNDEGQYIKETVTFTGAVAQEVLVDANELLDLLPLVLRHNDEPLNTPTWLVHWMLMEKARRLDLPVLLDGTGGDELLAGYHPHHLLMLADLEESGDGSFRHELTAWCARVGTTEQSYRDAKPRFGRLRGPLLRDVDPDIVFMTSGSRPDGAGKAVRLLDRRSAATSAVRREFAVAHPILLSRPNPMWNKGLLKAQLYQEITAEAIPAALRPADRSSMAFGVEIRSPFLDHRLVEFSLGLPGRFSIRDGVNKWLLREGMTGKMPEVVRTRADKQGMNVPSTRWLRGPWKDRVRSVLASDAVKDHRILNQTEVLRRFDEHVAGEGNHYLDIWHWYNLELWLREHEVNR